MTSKAELALILSLVDDVSKTAKGVRGNLLDLGHASGGVQGRLVGLGKIGFGAIVGGAALAGTALTGIGALAFKSAMDIDNAMDTITIGTGATGERLSELKVVMTDVLQNTASSAATVSGVLAALDAKLEASDEDMYNLTLKTTELSRMMGTDATQAASLFARTLGDWGVSAEEGSGLLDKMFVATQNSGIGFERLNELMVQFGAPMRTFGFSIEESMALLSKWEKEGVNTELVMGSLRIAAGKFAKAGKPLRESLLQTFNSIQTNTDATAALAEGMQVFGARAGPDMTAAIREGRFAIDDMVAMMGDAEGAILDTARATEDWPEKLARAKNRIMVILAPIGDAFIGLAGKVIDRAMPALGTLGPWIEENVVPAFDKIGGAVDIFFQGLENGRGPLESVKDVLWKLLPPGMAADLTGAIGWVQTLIGEVKEGDWASAGGMIWEQIKTGFNKALDAGKQGFSSLGDWLEKALGSATYEFDEAGFLKKTDQWAGIGAALWGKVKDGFRAAVDWGANLIEEVRGRLATALGLAGGANDMGAGQANTTWGVIGRNIGGGIVNGVVAYFREGLASMRESRLAVIAWSASAETQADMEAAGKNLASWMMNGFNSEAKERVKALNPFRWENVKETWENQSGVSGYLTAKNLIAGFLRGFLPSIQPFGDLQFGGNANGTDWWRGGPTVVGERGPEIVNVPRGSQILSNSESQKVAGGGATYNIVQNFYGPTNAQDVEIGVLRSLRGLGVSLP